MAGKRKVVQNDATTIGVAGPMYFYEDEVFHVTKSGDIEFGMVTENWEMYSSDEEDSDPEKVPTGCVAVTWHPKGRDDVLPETKVKLSDRSLMPGDVVRRLIAGKDTQRGYCRAVRVAADVQILGAKKVIPQILAVELQPVQKFQMDVAVYLDSWIGMVRDMHYKVYLKFSDGSACSIDSRKILDKFEDTRRSAEIYVAETFYPGQKLQGAMRYLKDADWSHMSEDIKRAKDRKSVSVTVTDVKPMSMHVQWQSQTPESSMESNNRNNKDNKNNWERDPPPDWLEEKDLKRVRSLNLFESCTVQLGDISFYTPKLADEAVDKTIWKKQLLKYGIHRAAQGAKKEDAILSDKQALSGDDLDVDIPTDGELVVSDAGNEEETVKPKEAATHATKKALPKVSTRSLRKKKLKKARHHPTSNVTSGAPLVVETIHTQSTVDVVWQDGTIEEGMRSTDLYPIHHLDDHEFFPGDFVVRAESMDFRGYGVVQTMDHTGRVALVKWFEVVDCNDPPNQLTEEEMSVYDIKDHPDYRFRPGTIVIRIANVAANQYAAGQILDNYPDGQVRVWWANGAINSCWPQDLFRLGEYDSDEGELWDDNASVSDNADDNASTDSWETEAEEVLNDSDVSVHKERYQTIGKLIKKIQESLVCIRETIVASSPVVVPSAENIVNRTLNVDRRGITKKLLMIYKDCQYLDKIMGSKHFDEQCLKQWFKQMESSSKSGMITADITKLFEIPDVKQSPLARSESLTESVDLDRSKTESSSHASIHVEDLHSSLNTSTSQATKVYEDESDTSSQTIFVTELCSLILQKLLSAHKEYETRFGSKASETIKAPKASDPLRIMATIAEEFMEDGPTTPIVNKIAELCSRAGALVCDLRGTDETNLRKYEESPSKPEENAAEVPDSPILAGPLKLSEELGMSKVSVNNNALESCMSIKFSIVDAVPDTHRYRLTSFMPSNQKSFIKTIQKEIGLLQNSLPDGIYVKGYEDRMDLFSVMICGPENTPYEDGLFFFDIQLPPTYPSAPPSVHYVSFCPDRLNPNLYECGKVCVSLLGTWNGKGTEVWTSSSSLLQLLISIQGLILVPEPYYNEAGYEKQRGSQQGEENSRMYNEMVLIKLVQSMSRMLINRHAPYETEIGIWANLHYKRLIERYNLWLEMSEDTSKIDPSKQPGFPLLPVSKGFAITLKKTQDNFAKLCDSALGSNDEPMSQ